MISSRQIRAARALLDWSQDDLAASSGLSIATIRKLELGHISPRPATTHGIRHAIENAGLEFLDPDGVRRRHEDIVVYQGQEGFASFFDDLHDTLRKKGGEMVMIATPESAAFGAENIDDYFEQLWEAIGVHRETKIKCLLTDLAAPSAVAHHSEFRSLSRQYVDPLPFYVYGDKYAMITGGRDASPRIVIIRSASTAHASRRQFYSMWDKATPVYAAPMRVGG